MLAPASAYSRHIDGIRFGNRLQTAKQMTTRSIYDTVSRLWCDNLKEIARSASATVGRMTRARDLFENIIRIFIGYSMHNYIGE